MVNNRSRSISNERLRTLLDAIEIQMGSNGLRLMLRNANLERYIDHPPPLNQKLEVLAQDYTNVLAALRAYFGVGARSTMLRIGADIFRLKLNHHRLRAAFHRLRLATLDQERSILWILDMLAAELNKPEPCVTLGREEAKYHLIDACNDRTVGIQSEFPICWTAVGEIAEALHWGTKREYRVLETSCFASGGESCTFVIS
jgi:predicted hydrocarbon binding protein